MLVREAGGTVHRLVRDGRPAGILAARPGLHAPIAALIDTVGG
jgi:hypothetical protein